MKKKKTSISTVHTFLNLTCLSTLSSAHDCRGDDPEDLRESMYIRAVASSLAVGTDNSSTRNNKI
jgi:hypothetical protein